MSLGLQVSIPDRDYGFLKPGASTKAVKEFKVSIPDRDYGFLKLVRAAYTDARLHVSIPDRDYGFLKRQDGEMITIFSFQGSFARTVKTIASQAP